MLANLNSLQIVMIVAGASLAALGGISLEKKHIVTGIAKALLATAFLAVAL